MKRQRPKAKGKGSSPRPQAKKQNQPAQPKSAQPKSAQPKSKLGRETGEHPVVALVAKIESKAQQAKSQAAAAKSDAANVVTQAARAEAAKAAKTDVSKAGKADALNAEKGETQKSKTITGDLAKPGVAEKSGASSVPSKSQTPTQPSTDRPEQRWSELQLEVPAQQEDMASWVLVKQCGALGCEVVPGKSGKVVIRASYEKSKLNENTVRSTIAILEEYGLSDTLRSLKVKDIPQEDWLAKWKEGFEPFRVGTKFLIVPVWRQEGLSDALKSGRIVILIEPGMAFGTGLHATTQFCLRALESYPPNGDVLDVGTGSGILAMAAKMLNPKARVIGVDTDPVAIETAKTDLDFNELVGCVELRLGSVETVADRTFDMILSNLTCEDIVALLGDYVKLLKPNGKVICAGILKEKMPLLETAIKRFPLNIEQSETFGTWVGVVLQR
jgi:Ribosomal protein L11 methylase